MAASEVIGAERGDAFPVREVGAREVSRAAERLGELRADRAQSLLARLAGRDRFSGLLGSFHGLSDRFRVVRGKVTRDAALQFRGEFRIRGSVAVKHLLVIGFELLTRRAGVERVIHVLRNLKRAVLPAERLLRRSDFLVAERSAVHLGGALELRGALADRRLADNEGRLFALGFGFIDRLVHRVDAVAVDRADHVPAIGFETLSRIVTEPALHVAVDRNAVVVIESDELAELPDTGERARFVAHAFHEAAVAEEHIRAVIDHGEAGAVEFSGEHLLGERHADAVRNTLAKRPGARLDPRGHTHFRVTRRTGVQLTEGLQIIHRKIVAREVQQRVLEHRAVSVRQNEAIAAEPLRVFRVVAEMAGPQGDSDICHAEGHAGVTRLGFLNGIHGKCTDGVCELLRRNGRIRHFFRMCF